MPRGTDRPSNAHLISRLRSVALLAAAAVALACTPSSSVEWVSLDEGWEFRQEGQDPWRPATVPGAVHTDLLDLDLIEDPFWRDNESRLQWIEEKDWHYRSVFHLPAEMQRAEHVELVFEGLDTYAEVRLNDVAILEADNMFRRWEVEVGDVVRPGENRLDVIFRSPVASATPALEAHEIALPVDNEPTRPFARKAAYHYGWDWGPRFATVGIWRSVKLRAWSGFRIAEMQVAQRSLTDEGAELTVTLEVASRGVERATVEITSPDGSFEPATLQRDLRPGIDAVEVDLVIPDPERWWPNGLGAQRLYDVHARLSSAGSEDTADRRVGLRTVEVVTRPDSIGESFHVEVNGAPVFMKGANYVPADHFTPRSDGARYRRLFEAVAAAHMNMLRVWGGGIYESDLFYDLADEFGILIWQDFMFANAMVPANEAFLASVAAEARDQVRRLRHHPSLALWCGNNEIDEAWHNWGWSKPYTPEQAETIWSAYEQVFHRILPQAVAENDPGRFYWPSSPSIGWGREESLDRGDSHYWGVWHGREPFEILQQKLPRFASEFGFQAYPSLATVQAFTAPEDRDLDSPVMASHQKHGAGLEIVREYMARWYRRPKDFPSFLYVSQLLQAEGMALVFEAQRRAMPRTMGTLYWQLNDTWPVASWSSLDYYGRWKALHYAARASFAPVLVSPFVRDGTLEVHVVSDRQEPFSARLELRLLGFDGVEQWSKTAAVTVEANGAALALLEPVESVLGGGDPTRVVLQARLVEGDTTVAENLLYFVRPKDLELPPVKVSTRFERDGDVGRLRLSSEVLAKSVHLTIPGVEAFFADNFFDLLPGVERIVQVRFEGEIADHDAGVQVRTLRDSY